MTQVPGSWEKSLRSIKEIISLGAKVAGVIVITKYNIKHIKESVLQLADLRVNYIMLNRFNLGGRGIEKFGNLQLDKPQLNRAFAEANEVGRSLSIPITSNVCTPLCLVNPENYPHIKFAACSPDIDRKPLTLDILGNLRICNHSPVIMGNIYKEKLSDILSSDYALSWYTVPDYCSECKIFDKCYGGCRGASEQIGRSLRDVDPVLTDLPNDERRALSNL
jgi:radical SAM protein with 4Fe4S-binding SPASM domain